MRCNRDCLHCIYDDCIEDELTAQDYRDLTEIDSDILHPKTPRQRKIAAYKREYYEANREQIAAYKREYMRAYRRRKKLAGRERND